jgi:hypothetical protein
MYGIRLKKALTKPDPESQGCARLIGCLIGNIFLSGGNNHIEFASFGPESPSATCDMSQNPNTIVTKWLDTKKRANALGSHMWT